MAITICSSPSSANLNNSILGGSTTLSHTVIGGNNRLLLAFWNERNATSISLAYNGTAMNLLFSQAGGLGTDVVNCYYLMGANLPAAGAYNLVPSGTGRGYGQLGAISFSNVSQTVSNLAYSSYATGNGNSVASRSFTTINSALLLLWAMSNNSSVSPAWSPTSPAVEWADSRQTGPPASNAGGVYQYVTTGGSATTITETCSVTGFITCGSVRILPAEEVLGQPIFYE